jgi:predicted PhzF superfamily epimerase YddE/YHI9
MGTLKIYQADAFANHVFAGNPAAVIPLETWLPDETMQQLAIENNLSETVFVIPSAKPGADFDIRWFTPGFEINLCGHATLAASFILFEKMGFRKRELVFSSQSGPLKITRDGNRFCMDFPSWKPERVFEYPPELLPCLGNPDILGVYLYREWIVELNNEKEIRKCSPDYNLMSKMERMVIITAPGDEADFVSRFFGPTAGVNEDPVTGSAHSQLIPFWSEKLGKTKMFAKQLSQRGGEIWCEQLNPERVLISGDCVLYMEGEIFL